MTHGNKIFRLSAAFAAGTMVLGSSAAAAPVALSTVDPLVSLSVFGTSSSRAAVCAAGAATTAAASAAATAAQPGPAPGCVLPVLGTQPVVETVPPPVAVVEPVGGGFNFGSLLPLAAIAGLGLLAILWLENQDDDTQHLPVSPT